MATIEINGKTFEVEHGKMIIEVADEANIHIPRFCYHKKLSIAANCRMCLVEIEGSKKTVPACATPISDGMKIHTQSASALQSQQAVMEFLLINHPLDCPICDQGGECELQDVSMGYGRDTSRYDETKRSVADQSLGSLVATEMTRCIHCTRCVRFGTEIAGMRELGALGRGEHVEISTYVEQSLASEISGNIIDLCPVGALTSKPYRFTARPWEMKQYPSIAPHDCLGSHVSIHTRRDRVMRVVPRESQALNETWLSDRDRFSYLGLYHEDRTQKPLIKKNGRWLAVDWSVALQFATEGIAKVLTTHGASSFAAFAGMSQSTEEYYLLQKLMRGLGVSTLDYRIQQTDVRDQASQPIMPISTFPVADLEKQQHVVIIGCQLSREVPLLAVRLRKAVQNGATVYAMNAVQDRLNVPLAVRYLVPPQNFVQALLGVIRALALSVEALPQPLGTWVQRAVVTEEARCLAEALTSSACLVTGALIDNHPDASLLRTLLTIIEQQTGAKRLHLTAGGNAAGAAFAGMLPHRGVGGGAVSDQGLSVSAAFDAKLKGYFLLNADPAFDFANSHQARQACLAAEFVVALAPFTHETLEECADVILPIALYPETSGTYINVNDVWQSVRGAVKPFGEARPAWKILNVLSHLLHVPHVDFDSTEAVLSALKIEAECVTRDVKSLYFPEVLPTELDGLVRIGDWPLYRVDALVRHADALQQSGAADSYAIRMHPHTADVMGLGEKVTVSQGEIEITLPLMRDDKIAPGGVWVANTWLETLDLGRAYAQITVKIK